AARPVPRLGGTAALMRALTLTQPFATLIAIGAKTIETRSWRTSHRGPLAIHAAAGFPRWAKELCAQEPFAAALRMAGYTEAKALPRGAVVAVCLLDDCVAITEENRPAEPEASFGDYREGRWAWQLSEVRALSEPVRARGALGLWQWAGG
ncbi:MAG: ASCH domain-containing protein, partial [Chloroflexi bacterium]|nr:ASCH domain-containing protein [Chloroflexota bacterium]